MTALHIASRNGHDEVVRVLLAAKATVNTQDRVSEMFTVLAGKFRGVKNSFNSVFVSKNFV